MIDDTIVELTDEVGLGIGAACTAVGRPRSSHHRRTSPAHGPPAPPASRKGQRQPRALTDAERTETLSVLHDERFVDQAPASVYATLLDENRYLCSISSMYRLLRERGETGERRRQATHPATVKPELVATQGGSPLGGCGDRGEGFVWAALPNPDSSPAICAVDYAAI